MNKQNKFWAIEYKGLKKLIFCCLLFTYFFFTSCKDNIDQFVDYEVTFFIDHPNYAIQNYQFETITENNLLVKDAHNEGATFETKTEQILKKDEYTSYQTFHQNKISIENDCELNTSIDLNCREFLDSLSVIKTQHPAAYMTHSYEVVLVNGNGPIVPAEYINSSYQKRIIDGALIPVFENNRDFEQVIFRLPFGISIDDYIQNAFYKSGVSNCISGLSYIIE